MLLLILALFADHAADKWERFDKLAEERRQVIIEQITKRISQAEIRLAVAKRAKRASAIKQAKEVLEIHERELEKVKKAVAPDPLLEVIKPTTGDIGRLPGGRLMQVVDEKSVIAVLYYVEQVPGGRTYDVTVWIDLPDTADLVDNRAFDPPGLFECVGTKRYETSDGSSTVPRFKQIERPKKK